MAHRQGELLGQQVEPWCRQARAIAVPHDNQAERGELLHGFSNGWATNTVSDHQLPFRG
jgi:hypothetical protein